MQYSVHKPLNSKQESTKKTSSVFWKERSTSTYWQYGTPSILLLYPVSAFKLQHNTHWCGYMALKPNSALKKKIYLWDWFFGNNQAILKNLVQNNLGHTNINRCLPFYLAFVTTEKRIANLPALTKLTTARTRVPQVLWNTQCCQSATEWTD